MSHSDNDIPLFVSLFDIPVRLGSHSIDYFRASSIANELGMILDTLELTPDDVRAFDLVVGALQEALDQRQIVFALELDLAIPILVLV